MKLYPGIDYYIRYARLPVCIGACSTPNDDGTFDIYINELLPFEKQRHALLHELSHIKQDHFYRDIPEAQKEEEAEKNLSPDDEPDVRAIGRSSKRILDPQNPEHRELIYRYLRAFYPEAFEK